MNQAEKKVLKTTVDLMWDCYQRIARTPDDDHWSRIFVRAKDIHQAVLENETES